MSNLAEIVSDIQAAIVSNPHSYSDAIEYGHVPILVDAMDEILRLKSLHEMGYSTKDGLSCEETLSAIFNILDGESNA